MPEVQWVDGFGAVLRLLFSVLRVEVHKLRCSDRQDYRYQP